MSGVDTTSTTQKYDVFISHASEDKADVRRFTEQLRRAGVLVWLDEEQLAPGHDTKTAVEAGLKQSRHVVLWVTQKWVDKRWTQWELMVFAELPTGRGVIPVMHLPWDHLRLGPYLTWQARIPMGLTEEQRVWLTLCGIRGTAPGEFQEWARQGALAMGQRQPPPPASTLSGPVTLTGEPHAALQALLALGGDPTVPPSDAAADILGLTERVERLLADKTNDPQAWSDVYKAGIELVERIEKDTAWRKGALDEQLPQNQSFERIAMAELGAPERDAIDTKKRLARRLEELESLWMNRLRQQRADQIGVELANQGMPVLQSAAREDGRTLELSVAPRVIPELEAGIEHALRTWARHLHDRLAQERAPIVEETAKATLSRGHGARLPELPEVPAPDAGLERERAPVVRAAAPGLSHVTSSARFWLVLAPVLGVGGVVAAQLAGNAPLMALMVVAIVAAAGFVWVPVCAEIERRRWVRAQSAAFDASMAAWWKETAEATSTRYEARLGAWLKRALGDWAAALQTWWDATIAESRQVAESAVESRSEELKARARRIGDEIRQLEDAEVRLAQVRRDLTARRDTIVAKRRR